MRFTEPLFIDWLLGQQSTLEPILEVGAGWTPETNQSPFRSHGYTEFLTQDIAEYPGKPAPDFVCDVCSIPKAGNSVGTILCFNVLEHCYAPWRAVPECTRLLREGGWFIGSVPCRASIHRHSRDYWRIMPDGIAELLRPLRLQYFVIEGNPEMPANILFAAIKDSRRDDWLEHNETITSQPLLITDTDYYTETQWKRWVVRLVRRMGYDIGLWSRHDDRDRMNALGFSTWTIVPQGQFTHERDGRVDKNFGTLAQPTHEDTGHVRRLPRSGRVALEHR